MIKAPSPDGAPAETGRSCSRRNLLTNPSITDGIAVGIDIPGRGHVRFEADVDMGVEEPPAPRANQPAKPYRAGEVPPALYGELRNETIVELLFALRALAETRVFVAPDFRISHCLECGSFGELAIDKIAHSNACGVGRVFRLIEDVYQQVLEPNPSGDRKEVAEAPEPVGAGSGNSSRGLYGEPWSVRTSTELGMAWIYDEEGDLVAKITCQHYKAADLAARIADCVNTLSGVQSGGVE